MMPVEPPVVDVCTSSDDACGAACRDGRTLWDNIGYPQIKNGGQEIASRAIQEEKPRWWPKKTATKSDTLVTTATARWGSAKKEITLKRAGELKTTSRMEKAACRRNDALKTPPSPQSSPPITIPAAPKLDLDSQRKLAGLKDSFVDFVTHTRLSNYD
ncbi:hypothetical protein V498_06132 [Pseudogymnoascus sp. VKM F-4517 (FW-2822)]|nr:hypothetical protein V498_06132 [Pseudogymnoascus sp. VKM F-4517 (FW-2822)]